MKYEILCVDDEQDMVDILTELIQSEFDYTAVGFTDPKQAIEYLHKNHKKVSLIISDMNMGDMDGFEFRKEILNDYSNIPFVVITGFYDKELAIEAMELSIQSFLDKPYEKKVIEDIIEKFSKPREEQLQDEIEMITGFLQESSPMLDNIEDLILELEEEPDNKQTLPTYFRLLHTIKGTASCVGLDNMGSYTHKYEDFVGEMRDGSIPVNPESIDVLLKGLDGLKEVFEISTEQISDKNFDATEYLSIFEKRDFAQGSNGHLKFNKGKIEEENEVDDNNKNKPKEIKQPQHGQNEDEKMTVSMSTLDEFMEESGELTVLRNTISKTVKSIEMRYRGDEELDILNDLLDGLYKVTSNIQNKIVELRKVKLGKVFRPFKRLTRDISKSLNKKVDIAINGEEIAVDNILAKIFSNTFIHLVRNSLDHGIEIPEKRLEAGKPEEGNLTINVIEAGDEIYLDIVDDGKGIDPEVIKKIALSKGLYQEDELKFMNDKDIINIIFDSGFSTAEAVSDLSGRGVGMDMVKSTIENHGGSIHVESTMGEGTTFKIRVPVPKSVLIVQTLQVQCGEDILKISMDEVVEVLRVSKDKSKTRIHQAGGGLSIEHHNDLIPLLNLGEVLNIKRCQIGEDITNVVIIKHKNLKCGIIVDEINDFEEVVCKKITEVIHSHQIYSGASIIGNGQVAMIVSSAGIMEKMGIKNQTKKRRSSSSNSTEIEELNCHQYLLFESMQKQVFGVELKQVERLEKVKKANINRTGGRYIMKYNDKALILFDPIQELGLSEDNILDENLDEFNFIVVNKDDYQLGVVIRSVHDIVESSDHINSDTINMNGLLGSLFLKEKTTNIIDVEYFFENYFKHVKTTETAA